MNMSQVFGNRNMCGRKEKAWMPCRLLAAVMLLYAAAGCAPAVIGAGATGAYSAGTDQRTLGEIWDDGAITTEINARLIQDPVTKARKIDVDTLEGVVLLTGVVETQEQADRAEEISKFVPGVKKVDNNLQVGETTFGQTIDDEMIGSRLKAELIAEPGIRSLNIDVDVYNGVVTLSGIVETEAQKEKVIHIARTTEGVVKVEDKIRVSGK